MSGCPRRTGAALAALLLAAPARAQSLGPGPDPVPPAQAMIGMDLGRGARHRFPQPVRAGALVGRGLLQPVEAQPILGRIAGVVRRADGGAALVVRLDGWLGLDRLGPGWLDWAGIGPRHVAVPIEAVGLLGEWVALMDLTPERLRALPSLAPDAAPAVGPDEVLRVGLVRPFH